MRDFGRARLRTAVAAIALLVAPAFASAAPFGEVDVSLRNEPRGSATHGYAEIEFLVVNRSAQKSHEVRVTYPKSSYSYGGDHIRAVTRTVTVEPSKSARLVIAYPERIDIRGSGAGVTIDGREQDDAISIGATSRGYSSSSYRSEQLPLILYGKSVDTRFPDWIESGRGMWGGSKTVEAVRADQDTKEWSTNWLGYTRYDGIAVTAAEWRAMPADVKNAIGQYVECGGSLLVIGANPQLPGSWKLKPDPDHALSVATPGFGQCFVTEQDWAVQLWPGPEVTLGPVIDSWRATATPYTRVREAGEANRAFPVVEDIGVPVKGLLALMLVFVVIIGPVNMYVLARKKRKLWLFWTVPAVSFVTCLLVLCYMAITEGWQGRSSVEGLTVLDENSRRASSLGWTGFYTPILPSDGLHFGPETELTYQNGSDPHSSHSYRSRRSSGSALTIDWTRDQHFSSGWLTPRVPAHFAFRKSELRRERMTITKGADGTPEAVNGLGADLTGFWYRDETGNLYSADAIPAGGRAPLKLASRTTSAGARGLRNVYSGDWSNLVGAMKAEGPNMLTPRTYLAAMDAAPFLDDGLPGASVKKSRSVVYGILKEGADAN